MPAGQGFGGWGSINDPVNCQGTITAACGGVINLNNGLTLSGSGNVNLGSERQPDGQRRPLRASAADRSPPTTSTSATAARHVRPIRRNQHPRDNLYLGYNAADAEPTTSAARPAVRPQRLVTTLAGIEYVGYSGTGSHPVGRATRTAVSTSGLYLGYNSGGNGTYSLERRHASPPTRDSWAIPARGPSSQPGGTNNVASTQNLGGSLYSARTPAPAGPTTSAARAR